MITPKNQSFKNMIFLLVASLFCGQVLAMDKVLNEDQEEYTSEVPTFPLPTSQFTQLFVPLAFEAENTFPIVFDQPQGLLIINYLFDGKCVARLAQINETTRFQSKDSKKYDFLLQSPLKTGALTVATQGSFAFQKPIEAQSASLTCKSVEFLDKFSSETNLILDVNYCRNRSDVTCSDILFKGKNFNMMPKSTLNILGTAALLPTQALFNKGVISCAKDALINTSSLENWGTLQAGKFHFEGGKILNIGSINIDDSFLGKCEAFDHRGKVDIKNDCIFEKVGKLSTTQDSSWKIGGNWKARIADLTLNGHSTVGNAALFTVDSHVVLNGPFRASIFHIESKDLITCNYTAQLFAAHYVGLKAQGWMQFEGNVFQTLQINTESKVSPRLNALLKVFPRGVFIHSVQSGIKKSGTILSKNGTVSLKAKKGLRHTGLTDAGFNANALLLMNAESLSLEKESILEALNARLTAKTSINQCGTANIQKQLVMRAPEIINSGSLQARSLFAKGNNITEAATSRIAVDKDFFGTQEKIVNTEALKTFEQLDINDQDISEATPDVPTKKVKRKASKAVGNQRGRSAYEDPDDNYEYRNRNFAHKQGEGAQAYVPKQANGFSDPDNPPSVPTQASFSPSRTRIMGSYMLLGGISVSAVAYWLYTKYRAVDEDAEEEQDSSDVDAENEENGLNSAQPNVTYF